MDCDEPVRTGRAAMLKKAAYDIPCLSFRFQGVDCEADDALRLEAA